ncbi:TonB-dependent receptor [Sphingomonas sp. AP4-R1]|uniref:TonB-dependent receptor n=1 Tax=Sphingomonas sp. AP4-R1 TaxID=2735134 RepID=UPI001493B438|nr:TonB-dependent receptor [Sphingomonas sp. AP4-R1]QJU59089.1 TonB-dependent receptor [Sphingomonas sp. AP4-R1]
MRSFTMLSVAAAAFAPAAAYADPAAAPATGADDRNTIVVTASPFATFSDDTPTIVAKVDRSQILQSGGGSIADALATTPGVSATSFAAGASRPIIRGMDATRVRLLEDGASSSDVSDIGPDHGIPIDPLAAQSIEVVRGPSTLRYGSQAIGGVVNVLNNRVPLTQPTQPITGEVTGSYGTAADMGEISALTDVKAGDFAFHADGFDRRATDYDTPLGTQENSYMRARGGSLGGSYFFGDSHVGAAVTQYNANYGIPSDDTHIVMRQTKALTRDTIAIDSGPFKSLDLTGSYATYRHSEVEPDGTVDTTFRNKEYDGRAELLLNPIGPVQNTAVGVEVQRRRFSAVGVDSSYLFPTLTQSEAAYLFTEMPLTSALRLQASGRVEHVSVHGTPASDVATKVDYTPISGSVGALLDAGSGVKLGLTFSSTGRAPAQTELFARGGHDGPNTFETGDPNLRIERANSLEGTLRVRRGKLHFDGSLYSTWFHNYIYGDLTGRVCDDDGVCAVDGDGDLRELNYRQQGAHFYGAEGEATYELIKSSFGSLSARTLADYTRATLDNGGNVPRIPPYRVGGGLTWQSKPFDANVLLLYVGKQDRFGAFDTETPHYKELNAQIAWRPFRSQPGVELALVGQNLTNDVQRAATSLNKDEVVMPGRNVRLVLRVATF